MLIVLIMKYFVIAAAVIKRVGVFLFAVISIVILVEHVIVKKIKYIIKYFMIYSFELYIFLFNILYF